MSKKRRGMPKNRERDRLATAIRRGVPSRPGVYLFYDRSGSTIYVGKSVNLRQRMLSYFGSTQGRLDYGLRQMAYHVHDFDFRETQTELLALLLEDTLIKRERPTYNTRQQEYEGYSYLVFTHDPFPTCRIVGYQEAATGAIFGPFRDRYSAANILNILNRLFQLRTCTDPHPFRKSLNFDLGYCTGPCRGTISAGEYSKIVGRVVDFLNGDETWIAEQLRQEIARLAAGLDYGKAAEREARLGFCRSFCSRQRFIKRFTTRTLFVLEQGDQQLGYRFVNGNLIEIVTLGDNSKGCGTIPGELLQPQTDPRFVVDRAGVIHGWLNRKGDACRFTFDRCLWRG